MLLGDINNWTQYRHLETGRIVNVQDAALQVKTDRHWQTCVRYQPEDSDGEFAVPVDAFRMRFEEVKREN